MKKALLVASLVFLSPTFSHRPSSHSQTAVVIPLAGPMIWRSVLNSR